MPLSEILSVPTTLPAITPANQGFWDHARRGVLALPSCRACGHLWYPPSPGCPRCLSAEVEFRAVSGRAKLWSWVVMHRQYFKDFAPPYLVAFVELEEGPMLMSTVVHAARDELRCDMPLRAVFRKLTDEIQMLQFEPVTS